MHLPNILYLLKVVLTIPATSASTERANSTLKFVKTWLRSTISQHFLNACLLADKHKDLLRKISLDTLVNKFIAMKRRWLLLNNPLSEYDGFTLCIALGFMCVRACVSE